MKVLLTDYSNRIITTAITDFLDEDLQSKITLKLNKSTLHNYLGKLILALKEKFPKHCVWEEPGWITRVTEEDFENKCKHSQGRGNLGVSEDNRRGLYRKASSWLNEIDVKWISKIDI